MALETQLTRMPRPFDPGRAADAVAQVPDLSPTLRALVGGAAGCSPYLAQLVAREAHWLPGACAAPDAALDAVLKAVAAPDGDVAGALRQAKRRVALLAALADLGGAWSLAQVTDALTRLADRACQTALDAALATQVQRGRLPDAAPGLFVLAMGKMGAGELNYSSDIDLICFFDDRRHGAADRAAIRQGCVRAVQQMCAMLSDVTADGYVFRTDLRLRPDPSVTPVVQSTSAAELYYEGQGRTWERAAFIKARVCAGDRAAGAAFLHTLTPFVWRRHLDFAAIEDAHNIRLAIRAHKGTGGPITLPGHDMKLGRGGIREIEFFTQTRQLIAGGRDAGLRVRDTVGGLARLAARDWVPAATADALTDHYRFARLVEHRVQMMRDAQTHSLPTTPDGFACLAAMMDTDVPALQTDLATRLSAVHAETEGFFAPKALEAPAPAPINADVQARWRSYPALRSARGAALFDRIEPVLLARLAQADKPAEALAAFDGFLSGLPAGVQLFALFEAHPDLMDLLVDIVSTSPALARYLSRNAGVLDAVIGGRFFAPWPGAAALEAEAAARLAAHTDYEAKLDEIRLWAKEWHFSIGVHHLRGLTDAGTAGRHYADLARAALRALWPEVQTQFARRHGPAPGRGAAILGMGSLGAGALTAQSDLDLIVIYDPQDAETSQGPRPLAARVYYARLTQALITAVTAQTAQGRLYEADMRLRPSGNQGPVATSLASYSAYQRKDAWLWEHLALVRAAVIAGPGALARDITAVRADVLATPRDRGASCDTLAALRQRIAEAKAPAGPWDAKTGPGRLQDIDLFAQLGAVLTGAAAPQTEAGLRACVTAGLLAPAAAAELGQTHARAWRVQMAARLLSTGPIQDGALGSGGRAFLTRAVEAASPAAAEATLLQSYDRAANIITHALRGA